MNVVLSFLFNLPFIAYFLKKNYSLRQNTLKILRVWEWSLTSVPIGVYLSLIEVGTWLGKGSAKELWRFATKWCPDASSDSASSVRSVHRRWTDASQEWPDAEQCFSSVRSEDGPTSGQTKNKMLGLTGLYWASSHEALDAFGHDLIDFGPLCCRPDSGWQRPVVATGASG